jgi:hypothetical protein
MPPKGELSGYPALAGQIDLNAPWVKPGFFDTAYLMTCCGKNELTAKAVVNATPLAEARAAAAEANRTVDRLTVYYEECHDRDMHFRGVLRRVLRRCGGAIEEDVEAAAEEDDEAAAAAIFEEDVESDPVESDPVKSDPHRSKRLRTAEARAEARPETAIAAAATKRAAKAAAQEAANAKEDLASWTTYAKECGKYFVYLNSIGDAHESAQFDKYDRYFEGIEQRRIEQDEKRKAAGKPADS